MSPRNESYEDILEDMGLGHIDVETPHQSQVQNLKDNSSTGTETLEISGYEPVRYSAYNPDWEITRRKQFTNGNQLVVNLSQVPVCPNCEAQVKQVHDEDAAEITICQENGCDTRICPICRTDCHSCKDFFCDEHTKAVGGREGAYCYDDWEDARAIEQHRIDHETWMAEAEKRVEVIKEQFAFKKIQFQESIDLQKAKMGHTAELQKIATKQNAQLLRKEVDERIKKMEEMAQLEKVEMQELTKREDNRQQRAIEAHEAETERERMLKEDQRERSKIQKNREQMQREQNRKDFEAFSEHREREERRRIDEKELDQEHRRDMAEEKRKMFDSVTDRKEVEGQLAVDRHEAKTDRLETQGELVLDANEQRIEEKKVDLEDKREMIDKMLDKKELQMKDRRQMVDIMSDLQDMRFNQINEMLDVRGRIADEGFDVVLPPEENGGEMVDVDPEVLVLGETDMPGGTVTGSQASKIEDRNSGSHDVINIPPKSQDSDKNGKDAEEVLDNLQNLTSGK